MSPPPPPYTSTRRFPITVAEENVRPTADLTLTGDVLLFLTPTQVQLSNAAGVENRGVGSSQLAVDRESSDSGGAPDQARRGKSGGRCSAAHTRHQRSGGVQILRGAPR